MRRRGYDVIYLSRFEDTPTRPSHRMSDRCRRPVIDGPTRLVQQGGALCLEEGVHDDAMHTYRIATMRTNIHSTNHEPSGVTVVIY